MTRFFAKPRAAYRGLALAALMLALGLALSACQPATTTTGSSPAATETEDAQASSDATQPGTDTLTIGVVQFAQHPSLDNCYNGLIEGLKQQGYEEGKNLTVDYQNANADTQVANQIAKNFVSRGYDLLVGIATPAAQAAYNAAREEEIPVIFNAVTDPIAAKLQNEDGSNLAGVTGTSDVLPIRAQLKMIRAFLPEAKTLGILYSTSEANSLSAIATYESLAAEFGFEIVSSGISQAGDVPMAAERLISQVDALTNLTDNLVVQNMPVIVEKMKEAGKPYFGSEEEQVRNGCVACEGIDYFKLGVETGHMAAEVLGGKPAADVPVRSIEDSESYYNSEVLKALGLELPAGYESMTDRLPQN